MSAVRKRLYYFWKKLSEKRYREKYKNILFKEDIERFQECKNKKPISTIKKEMKALHMYWGCYPFEYYRFDFFRSDCTLTLEEMKQYVPLFFLNLLYFPLSHKDYGVISSDKLLNYAMLKAYAIPQPRMLLCFDNNMFFDADNSLVTPNKADAIINGSSAVKLFVKPRFGSEGKGIAVFKKHLNRYVDDQQTVLDHSFFGSKLKDEFYVVQEGLLQHESMNRMYPHSINTFRIITECLHGEARVLYALIRMGRGGNQVDNAASGGIYIKVDPSTGVLADFSYAHNRLTFDSHPDTGFLFKDKRIEQWEEAKAFAIDVAQKFREIKHVGWDVALTTDGPAIIELNCKPDMAMIQDFYGGIRDDLKIQPKDWWYKSNFTIRNV